MPDATKKPKILAFAGSTRKDSFNKMLVKLAAKGAEDAGAEVTVIDLKDYPMPLYDGDDEKANGLPAKAQEFRKLLMESDGFIIASPEYNGSMTGVLKNAFDWASRKPDKTDLTSAFNGKVAILLSTGPGAFGGLRALSHVRDVLANLNTIVLPQMHAVGHAGTAFDAQGQLTDPKNAKAVAGLAAKLVDTINKLKP